MDCSTGLNLPYGFDEKEMLGFVCWKWRFLGPEMYGLRSVLSPSNSLCCKNIFSLLVATCRELEFPPNKL